jgi:maltooligosyltrehalose trehalohydrolase
LLLTAPFTPMLFQGEEWAATAPFLYFTDHRDPDLAAAVSAGRRHEFAHFGWAPEDVPDPQAVGTFERSRLDWDELDRAEHADLLAWYRELLTLRRRAPDLVDPRLERVEIELDESAGTLVVGRGSVRVLVNLGDEPHSFPVPAPATVVAASFDRETADREALVVPPDAVAIVA